MTGPTLRDQSFERILIVKPSSLGDIVHTLPALHALRRRYPKARIDWLVSTGLAGMLEGHSDLNDVIRFDRKRFARLWRNPRAFLDFKRFLNDLRARRYDLVIDWQGLLRTGFMAWATRAPIRLGFRSAREGAGMFYTHYVEDGDRNMHAVDRNLLVGNVLGLDDGLARFELCITESERVAAWRALDSGGIGAGTPWVAIVPAARWETKLWPVSYWAELIESLQSTDGIRCVILGGKDEVTIGEELANRCPSRPVNLAGRTDVRQFAVLIGLASTVVCLDSAAAHLAVAQNRPLVCITGPTNPLRTGPYRRMHDVARIDLDCSPCYYRRLRQCPHDHRCMHDLDSQTVLRLVRSSLKERFSPIQSKDGNATGPLPIVS